jgi:hypothetical protein
VHRFTIGVDGRIGDVAATGGARGPLLVGAEGTPAVDLPRVLAPVLGAMVDIVTRPTDVTGVSGHRIRFAGNEAAGDGCWVEALEVTGPRRGNDPVTRTVHLAVSARAAT